MEIRVSGHQVETGDALKDHVEERLTSIAEKYFSRAISARVTFHKGPHDHGFRCAIVAHVMQGVILKGEAANAGDAHAAFEEAAGHVEKQLRRHMDRLKDHHKHGQSDSPPPLPQSNASYTVFEGGEEVDTGPDNPPIIHESLVDIPETSVLDAVQMLDWRNTNALLFKNGGTGVYNMVYRRSDGSIGWVEPDQTK
jgi:ribosomal subunit interface protein